MPPSGLAVPERAQLDAPVLGIGYLAGPHDGLIEVFAVEDQDPAELLTGFGEGPISNQGLVLAYSHACGSCGRLQAGAGAQHSGSGHVAIEGTPGLVHLPRGWTALLRPLGFDAINERGVLWHL